MTSTDFTDNCKLLITEAKKELPQAEYLRHLYQMEGTISLLIAMAQSEEAPVKKGRGPNKPKTAAPTLNLEEK